MSAFVFWLSIFEAKRSFNNSLGITITITEEKRKFTIKLSPNSGLVNITEIIKDTSVIKKIFNKSEILK